MKIYYRVSNNSYNKIKLENATKEYCLSNFLSVFSPDEHEINIIADNVTDLGLIDFLENIKNIKLEHTNLNNAQSFKYVFEKSLQSNLNDIVYFVEDDYLHLPLSPIAIEEGIKISDYITLYDHPDKYINRSAGGDNPFIEDGGEITRVVKTNSSHWKLTNSTTMTFASTVSTLIDDKDTWLKHLQTAHPNDFIAFLELREKGRTLLSPLPGLSTHCEIKYLSPFTNWQTI